MARVDFNPQGMLRRVRSCLTSEFIDHVHSAVLRMLQGPRARMWKYPGLMHRFATPDTERLLATAEDATTFSVSRKWSRCCLILLMLRDRTVSVLFLKENNRIEIVTTDGRLPQSAFQGTIVDGYLDITESGVTFYAVDPVRYAGRWLGTATPLNERRRAVNGLYSRGDASTLSIRHLEPSVGVAPPRGSDKVALVYVRDRRGTYRAHTLCFTPRPQPEAADQPAPPRRPEEEGEGDEGVALYEEEDFHEDP